MPTNFNPGGPILENFLTGSLALSEAAFLAITPSVQNLLGILVAIALLVEAGKLLYPFGPILRVGKILNNIFSRVALALLVVIAIPSPEFYQRYVLYPIIGTSIEAADLMLTSASTLGVDPDAAYTCPAADAAADDDYEGKMRAAVGCQTNFVQSQIFRGMMIGLRSVQMEITGEDTGDPNLSWGERATRAIAQVVNAYTTVATGIAKIAIDRDPSLFLHFFVGIVASFVIIIVYGIAWIMYPLLIMNLVLKWAIISVLWPVLFAALVFPVLRPVSFSALRGLIHAGLSLIFLAVVAGIMMSILGPIWEELNADDLSIGREDGEINIYDAKYLMIVITGWITAYLFKKSEKLAGDFVGSGLDTDVFDGLWQRIKQIVSLTADVAAAGSGTMIQTATKMAAKGTRKLK